MNCPEHYGTVPCVLPAGHTGMHSSILDEDVADDNTRVWISAIARNCPSRYGTGSYCALPVGHEGPHADGVRFVWRR